MRGPARRRNSSMVMASLLLAVCSTTPSATTTSSPPAAPATTTPATTSTAVPPPTAPTTTTGATTTTVAADPALIDALPACETAAQLPAAAGDSGEVSFNVGGAIYVATGDGSNVACVGLSDDVSRLIWGPAGDRLVAGASLILAEGVTPMVPSVTPAWSRPTGTALVWVEGGRLLKAGIDESRARDLTFLARHDEVGYHPAGVEIASTGEAVDGTRGVWLSSNEGTEPRLMVRADAATIHEFTFRHDGQSAVFLADHGGEWHVHDIFLVTPEDDPGANEFDATISFESTAELSRLVVSPWNGVWAAQVGACGLGSTVVIGDAELPEALEGVEATSIGWLPDLRLVVATYPDGCDQPADIWLVSVVVGGTSTAELLVTDVAAAAVRAPVPAPPPPLGDVSLDDFA